MPCSDYKMMKGYVRGLRGDDVEHITCAFFSAHSYHLKLNDGDEVMQIDSTCSWKPKLSTIIKSSMVTMWMGDCYVLGFAPALRFLQSNFVQTTKVLLLRQKNQGPLCVCTRTQKDHTCRLKILWSMSAFGGLWKQQ